jgi:hypothetical protein
VAEVYEHIDEYSDSLTGGGIYWSVEQLSVADEMHILCRSLLATVLIMQVARNFKL